jgi:nitroreductase
MTAALAFKNFVTAGAAALPSSFEGFGALTADEWAAAGPLVVGVLLALYAPFLLARALLGGGGGGGADATHRLLTRGRRSVEQFQVRPVPRAAVARALEAAVHAPNHFLTEPWRFRLLNDAQAARLTDMSKFDGTKKILDNCPQLMVVSMDMSADGKNPDMAWNVRGLEDHAACACAVQNMMLSLASQGIGSKWMTGKMGISGEDVLGIFDDVSKTEHYMGTFLLGYPIVPMEEMQVRKRKKGISGEIFIEY